jgi:DNA-binding response OmpR family regulator
LRVLAVDDNRDAADSLAMLASIWGHEVRVAYAAASALSTASAFRPDVCLLDLGLPHISGLDLARALRRQPAMERSVLLAVTGHADETSRRRAEDAGIDLVLPKPVDPELLRALLSLVAWTAGLAGELMPLDKERQELRDAARRLLDEQRRQPDALKRTALNQNVPVKRLLPG